MEEKIFDDGEEGFQHGMTPKHLKRIRQLEKENEQLKKLLAEKTMESDLKEKLLKKRQALEKRKQLLTPTFPKA